MVMKAAQEMARKRWRSKTKQERSEHAAKMGSKAAENLTAKERSERARTAAQARWGKKKKTPK
jgi:hypothetical protein